MRRTIYLGLCSLVGLALVVWASTLLPAQKQPEGPAPATMSSAVPIAPALKSPRTPPVGYKEYRSEFYKFQMFYPADLSLKEYQEAGSARTVTFSNPDGRQFQIFVLPYGEEQITPDRFKRDVPSGVREGEQQIVVDGVSGVAFLSKDAQLGDTAEVWFIARGFLYEVTAPREQGEGVAALLSGWQFL